MKKKQLVSLLLAGAMTVGMLAGCGDGGTTASSGGTAPTGTESSKPSDASSGGDAQAAEYPENVNAEGYPIVKNPITVSMMGQKCGIHGDWDKMEFFQIMQEKTGIGFTFDTPTSEVLEEKKNLALNGGTYPEVMFAVNISREQQVKYGSQGILIPLEDYIEKYCPNIMKAFEENPGARNSITAPDGHIYSMAQIYTSPLMSTAMWVNIDWLDKLGVKPDDLPTTVDGYYELLKRFRDEDPNGNGVQDEIPLNIFDDANKGDSLYNNMMPYFGMLSPEIYVDDNGKIHYGMVDENAKIAFQYFNKLYSEKLVSSEMYTHGSSDGIAQGTEGLNGSGYHALPRFVFGNMTVEKEATYPCMPALSSEVNPVQTTTKGTGITQGVFALTDKCSEEVRVAMMRWLDYLYSEEGSWLIHYGPEGHIWEPSPNNPELNVYIQPTDGRNVEEVRGGEITPDCGAACPKWVRWTTEGAWDDVQQQARIAWNEKNLNPYSKIILPDMYLTEEEQSIVDMYSTDLKKYRQENGAKFVVGEKSFDEWDNFVQGMKDMHVDDMIAAYQTAYDRWAASGK